MYFTKEFNYHIHDGAKKLRKTSLNNEKMESKMYLE